MKEFTNRNGRIKPTQGPLHSCFYITTNCMLLNMNIKLNENGNQNQMLRLDELFAVVQNEECDPMHCITI